MIASGCYQLDETLLDRGQDSRAPAFFPIDPAAQFPEHRPRITASGDFDLYDIPIPGGGTVDQTIQYERFAEPSGARHGDVLILLKHLKDLPHLVVPAVGKGGVIDHRMGSSQNGTSFTTQLF
jgi:hypothetical protein